MTDHPTPDDRGELLARYAEADSLLRAARERAVHDHLALQQAMGEVESLRAQLAEAQDAYEQLSRLLEQQQTAPGEQQTPSATAAVETDETE